MATGSLASANTIGICNAAFIAGPVALPRSVGCGSFSTEPGGPACQLIAAFTLAQPDYCAHAK
jgi:hypothetical protein